MAGQALDELYNLLPVLYRLRDVNEGYPLRAFLRVVAEQVEIVRQNIDRLWDDFGIETCQPWVIPYLGDLVANNLLHDVGARARVDVARTIYYRRRKGTLPMLEQLARDVTGWGGHAVEFFELLGWTQNLNHLRLFNFRSPDLRDVDAVDRLDGPFDQIAHTVDIRPPSRAQGWHNIRNIGFFLYRLGSYALAGTQARQALAPNQHGYHFSSLGAPVVLFNRWRREGDAAGLAQEPFVPGPLRPADFYYDLERYRQDLVAGRPALSDYTGPELALAVYKDGTLVPAEEVLCKNLSAWDRPPAGRVAVDVTRGRITFAAGEEPAQGITVEYHYGFSDDTGGGPYDRRRKPAPPDDPPPIGPDTVADPTAFGTLIQIPAQANTISDALTLWAAAGSPPAVIQIEDDRTYAEDLTINMAGDRLTLQAENRRRPTLIGTITITGTNPNARIGIDGLLVEGFVHLQDNLKELRLAHATLVPGRSLDEDGVPQQPHEPSLTAEASNTALTVLVERCLLGPVRLPAEMVLLDVRDSIVDAPLDGAGQRVAAIARLGTADGAGPRSSLRRVTLLGEAHARELELASEVIFAQAVSAERTQAGCVRFSYVPGGSRTPRRYRCQPDLALAESAKALGLLSPDDLPPGESGLVLARLRPAFTSLHYGDPGYGQLSLNCPEAIKTGAEDGAEMGAFASLRQPQREANLRLRLEEYLPFGLQPALVYVT